MMKRMLFMLAAMTLIVGGVIGYKLLGRRMMTAALAAQKPPPAVVSTAAAQEARWEASLHAVGGFVATQGITVSAQLDGAVTKIAFEPGTAVEAGQLLVQQDIATETAQLESAEAAAQLAELRLRRAQELRARDSNAQSDLDEATAASRQAGATVAAIRSTIEKRTIRAPFAGRLGLRQVSLGQFLRSGAAIVSLQALDPIYFNFSLPQQNAAQIRRGQPVSIVVDAFPGETFAGAISAVNPGLDEATRAFQVQATVANTDRRLQPGMFGAADIRLPAVEQAVTVPLAAIVYNPYGNAVYLVEPDTRDAKQLTVRQQFVQTGAKRGDLVVIRQGVKAGAQVVTAGQLKLRNGSAVVVNNTVAVAASPAPQVTQP